jgi:hypothetical protein
MGEKSPNLVILHLGTNFNLPPDEVDPSMAMFGPPFFYINIRMCLPPGGERRGERSPVWVSSSCKNWPQRKLFVLSTQRRKNKTRKQVLQTPDART